MKVNFKRFEVPVSFDGTTQVFDIAETLANLMMYNGSILLDIGFESLAKEIYYAQAEVEVPKKYRNAIKEIVKESTFYASVKRQMVDLMTKDEES